MNNLKSNFAYNVLLTVSNLLFPIVSFPYLSRTLGPECLGKAQFIIIFAQYFVLLSAFGIPLYGFREVAKVKHDKEELSKLSSELLLINFLFSLLLFAAYTLIVLSISWFHTDLQLYAVASLFILTGFTSIDWFFTGVEEFKYIAVRSIVIKSLSLIALFALVKSSDDLIFFLLISIFSVLGNNIWNIYQSRRLITFRLRSIQLRHHLPVLFVFFITSLSISIYTFLDTLLLGIISTNTAVGYYTAAIKLNKIALPLIVSLGIVLTPKITLSINSKSKSLAFQGYFDTSFAFINLIGIPLFIGIAIFSKELLIVYAGEGFIAATDAMRIMSPLILFLSLGHLLGLQLLIPSGNEKLYFMATIFGLITSLSLNLVLIPMLDEKGAAIATLSAEVVVTSMCYFYVKKKLQIIFNWRLVGKAVLSCVLFLPISVLSKYFNLNIILSLTIQIAICILTYLLIQGMIFKEKLIWEAFRYLKSLTAYA
ncbi:MAG: hypothetical protein JWN56_2270 [Sphingobacteriales bacterium]|nr:hypothetical protein [Sphingobacteriales bacterium]